MSEEETQKETQTEVDEGVQRGPNEQILVVTDKGYATRTTLTEFRISHRGTHGVRAMFVAEDKEKGSMIAVKKVKDGDIIFILTKNGQGAIVNVDEIKLMGRGKAGVRIMSLDEGDSIVSVT